MFRAPDFVKLLFLFIICFLLTGAYSIFSQEVNIKVATWNYMCQEDAFADGYGCPGEIMLCMKKNNVDQPEKLTDQQKLEFNTVRFQRIAAFLNKRDFDMLLLQETEKISLDIIEKSTKYKVINSANEEAVLINNDSAPWKSANIRISPVNINLNSYPELKDMIDGIACVKADITNEAGKPFSVYFCSTHAKAGRVKALEKIKLFEQLLSEFTKKEFAGSEVIIGGDYNFDFHRNDVKEIFSAGWSMLTAKAPLWFDGFTTQHETNFYGAFDGFIIAPKQSSDNMIISEAQRILSGLMPKYLGPGPVTGHGKDMGNSLLQYNADNELLRADSKEIIPGCNAETEALSDHLPIFITINIK